MISRQPGRHLFVRLVLIGGVVVLLAALSSAALDGSVPASASGLEEYGPLYLPLIMRAYPWPSPFGVEVTKVLGTTLEGRADGLGTRWVRLHRVSWREIQPNEGDPYDWSVLESFEEELKAIKRLGATPVAIVQHSPPWATINEPLETDCGAIRSDKFNSFASFMAALVERYSVPEFNVHHWELGNEPDVDPSLVAVDSRFGCWGDKDDPYYGGRHYGEMLKVVSPAIRSVDPGAKVLIGGLLLSSPNTTDPNLGKPELFLRGILEAGAAPYFDIVPYHAYPSYTGLQIDYDTQQPAPWFDLGGWTLGKARYLRDLMEDYGVDKPLHLNEMALGCDPDPDAYFTCPDPPPPDYFTAQANFLVRTMVRDLSEDLSVVLWYTLDGPGWRSAGLLDEGYNPRPAYYAYRNLVSRLAESRFVETLEDYGPALEAYAFVSPTRRVHVVWSVDTTSDEVLVAQSEFLAAYNRAGAPLTPVPISDQYMFTVGFSPIYIELRR